MAKKTITYDMAQAYIKDKDTAINTFIETSLVKTQQIFAYENLPDTIPQSELEKLLQTKGHCIIAKEGGELYAFTGGFSGENDVYNNPRFYTVSNVALNLYKTFEIGVDCVLVKNDFYKVGMLPTIQKYGVLLTDGEISLNTAAILSRITMLISAPDDKTKASADLFMQKILNGDFSVIGENGFFDGVRLQTGSVSNSSYITQLIELTQYYKASFLNEIGLNANFNMKRERLNESEVLMNIDNLLPFIENMYSERVTGVEKVNEMFDCEIVVDYNGVWKTTHEHADKEEVFADTETNEDIETVDEELNGGENEEEKETNIEPTDTETASNETEEPQSNIQDKSEMVDTDVTEETGGETVETEETEETEEKQSETVSNEPETDGDNAAEEPTSDTAGGETLGDELTDEEKEKKEGEKK